VNYHFRAASSRHPQACQGPCKYPRNEDIDYFAAVAGGVFAGKVTTVDRALAEIHGDGDAIARILNVVQVISVIGIIDVHVVALIPVVRPVFRYRVEKSEPITIVFETRTPGKNYQRKAENSEPMVATKITAKTVLWNSVPAVASTLLPGAVLDLPTACAMLFPDAALFLLGYALSSL
jgi:hypothetical protein